MLHESGTSEEKDYLLLTNNYTNSSYQ